MTRIYYTYINKAGHDQLLNDSLSDFPKAYRDKIHSFRRWQDTQLSLLGRLLLKYGLEQMGETFDPNKLLFNDSFKPFLESSTFEFNISHSGHLVICAISDYCEIGVDIENLRKIEISDFKPQMTQNEWSTIIDSEDTLVSFFEYWTQKEAVLKAHGSGMSTPLKSFENKNFRTRVNNSDFFLKEIKLDQDYKCYLAFNGKPDPKIVGPLCVNRFDLS